MEWLAIVLAIIAIPGIFATLIPTMPGIPYMYTLAIIFGFVNGWESFTAIHITVLTGVLILSILTDYFSGIIGAKYGGATGRSLKIGFICLILGTIVAPPFGGFLALFLGIMFSELVQSKTHIASFRSASFSLAGAIAGVLINFMLAIAFYVLFLVFMF